MISAKILLVEDDEAHRSTLARHFRGSGHEVLAVETAEEALNRIASFDPEVVVTDIQMPGMDGFELLKQLTERSPDVDVILVTGYAGVQGAIDAMKEGAYDYLVKPLDVDQVDEVLGRCISERREAGKSSSAEPESDIDLAVGGLVGKHPSMMQVYKTIGTVASSRAPVLILGETGTGKELIARTIHLNSKDSGQPFIPVNCAAVPESLLESELFGHVKGAFTGAAGDRRGRFEMARRGTVFLDEVGDTSLAFQAKLLRVLQEREFYPVGGEELRRTEARVIAATHRTLTDMVEEGTFREDLYFRLQVIEIYVPPLRERRSDIPLLATHILAEGAADLGRPIPSIPPEVMAELVARDWPGNVRELENTLTRALVLSRGATLTLRDIGGRTGPETPAPAESTDEESEASLEMVERRHVQEVLLKTGGNKSAAARILDISRPRLDRMIDRHKLVL